MNQEQTPWWEEPEYWDERVLTEDDIAGGAIDVPCLQDVIAEAERRGREKALEDVRSKSALSRMVISPSCEPEDVLILPKSFFES